jgi:hypothetical protein
MGINTSIRNKGFLSEHFFVQPPVLSLTAKDVKEEQRWMGMHTIRQKREMSNTSAFKIYTRAEIPESLPLSLDTYIARFSLVGNTKTRTTQNETKIYQMTLPNSKLLQNMYTERP